MTDELKRAIEEAKNNPDFVKELGTCSTPEKVIELLSEKGYQVSIEELMEQLRSGGADEMKDLTIDELDAAAGGAEGDYSVGESVGYGFATFGTTWAICVIDAVD